MTPFQRSQEILDSLIPLPVNLSKVYLLGDTGAGKTTIIGQLLGTTSLRFPSVKRTRTAIAVTEYVLSKESKFRAAIVFKPAEEVHRYVREILEDTILKASSCESGDSALPGRGYPSPTTNQFIVEP